MATLAKQRGVELYRMQHPTEPGTTRAIWSGGRVLERTTEVPRWRVQGDFPVGSGLEAVHALVLDGWRMVAAYTGHGRLAEKLTGREKCRRCGHRQAVHVRGCCRYVLGCWCTPPGREA